MLFAINTHGHYFGIEGKEVNQAKLKELGCTFYSGRKEMYQAIADRGVLHEDEIKGSEFIFSWMDNQWVEFNPAGYGDVVEFAATEDDIDEDEDILYTNIEDYLANWQF